MKASQTKQMTLMAIFTALSIVVGFIEIPWPFSPIPGLKIDFSEVVILVSFLFLGFSKTTVVVILRSLIRELTLPKGNEYLPYVGEFMAIYSSIVLMLLYSAITWLTRSKMRCIIDVQKKILCEIEETPSFTDERPKFIVKDHVSEFVQPPLWKIFIHTVFVVLGFTVLMTLLNFFITVPIYVSMGEHFFYTSFVANTNYAFITGGNTLAYFKIIVGIFAPFNLVKGILIMLVYELTKMGIMRMDLTRL